MASTTFIAQTEFLPGIRSLYERVIDRPWVALIELLLIGAVVYIILRFLQGTRGARLMRAVLTILVVSFVLVWLIADKLESERIKVLYPYFILGVFLVSLVAFQAELRRFLLRVGEGFWLRRWIKESSHLVDPIVTAAERLSKKKIGALMAVERTGEVGALTEAGVRLDAVVTAELLETIFWPGTPLHDLGVVIHSGRIIAAGCQFPLAESGEVDRSLGSRHRAALGLSQEVDAVVIVVSEETGTISVAAHGRLRRGLNAESLREVLIKELSDGSGRAKARAGSAVARQGSKEVDYDGTSQAA
ncbi:MAG: TIGR00159 family protein [Planctomycetes bacterium]|nr:TIGR00159 family protein [Planctomycetota bacterium]